MTPSYPRVHRRKGESPGDLAQRLQIEAAAAAAEQLALVGAALRALSELSATVANGGSVYPAGTRELCRRLAEDADSKLATLEQIASRNGAGPPQPLRLAR